ncbi:MAG: hypothetical protein LBH98_04055 [Chitinispirillales bacterium]|jgi:hypothetical protein|nr:hypothetical protein [Chitinispirillales bacterium]
MTEMFENEESISVEEIIELALRYIDKSEISAVVRPKGLFALFSRRISVKNNEDWNFTGYGLLVDYTINSSEKPVGKWINMKYISLNTFPPQTVSLKLQPPHIAKGYFQNFDRTSENKIVAIFTQDSNKDDENCRDMETEAEILQFSITEKE